MAKSNFEVLCPHCGEPQNRIEPEWKFQNHGFDRCSRCKKDFEWQVTRVEEYCTWKIKIVRDYAESD